jgi:ectoine hydroxylase-related dioxygenase (phytanoyl-CoA dioxygenase family)
MDLMFRPNFLLSQSQVINILPGEKQQAYHYDDSFYQIPRPRLPLGAASIWAIDDFTEENGATVVVPASHKWDGQQRPTPDSVIKAVMLNLQDLLLHINTVRHLCVNRKITC